MRDNSSHIPHSSFHSSFFILHSSFFWIVAFSLCVPCAAFAQGINNRNSRRNGRAAAPAVATPSANAVASASAAEESSSASGTSDINFKDAPAEMIYEVYSKLVDRTVLKDPATPSATITLESRPGQKLTKEEQIEAIEVVLEMNGIHFENYGDKFVRALPRKDASKEGIPLFMDPSSEELANLPMGKVAAVMINFKNISAQDEAQKALEGFKTNSGLLQVFERTNSILVTDTRQNIQRMVEIARAIDVATPVLEEVFVRQIKNASATEIKTALEQIVTESQKELEKSGKAQQNAQNNVANRTLPAATLRRPGQNNNQPPQPTSLESLVTSVSDADRGLIRGKVLILADERSNKLVVITSRANMNFFDSVINSLDVETTPDTVVKVYRLKYAEAEDVSSMINDLIGNSASSASGATRANQNQNAKQGTSGNLTRGNNTPSGNRPNANQRSGDAKAGELSKDNTTVLADKRINGIVVMTQKELVPTIENIIESMDVKLSQVLIETVIIEVTLGDDLKTGIDWVQRGKTRAQIGTVTTTNSDGDEVETPVYGTVRDGLLNRNNYMLGGGGGNSGNIMESLITTTATNATTLLNGLSSGGINYFLKSDRLNLAAVIQASKTDSRAKYIASPVVMTVDNKEATIEATEARKFFSGYETSSSTYNYIRTPKYDSKDIGITIKVTPKINPNGTVMLTVDEEYSQLGAGQYILVDDGSNAFIDTALTRKMSADVLLENNQSVVLGGLTQTRTSESQSGIPFLKDIPWIGKWLFGSVNQSESRSELLVFMTPYVLDDAEAAQAEAFRRKKALSDPSPWEDHGWSASKLADPIEKKEMMRRLKDEAKKQDEERKTRLAIEKWKMDRAKALEDMDEEERKFWIDAHREELEKEERERFDESLKEQRDLKDLAESIRSARMKKAERKLDEAEAAAAAENEAGRLERKQAEAAAEPADEAPIEAPPAEPAEAPAQEPATEPSLLQNLVTE